MNKTYVLRTCDSDMTSHKGRFTWPVSGFVEAPDWDPIPVCGKGLHGFLLGCGDGHLADWNESAVWLVVEVDKDTLIDFEGKVKFPSGNVVFAGNRQDAIAALEELVPECKAMPVIGAVRATGDYGQAIAGDWGKAQAGAYGTAIAGNGGTAIAGNRGTAIAGNGGAAQAGYKGKAQAGAYGTAQAGEGGRISIEWYDAMAGRFRLATGYIGEEGLQADTPYQLDEKGKFVAIIRSSETPTE